jgi:hypothetical protein
MVPRVCHQLKCATLILDGQRLLPLEWVALAETVPLASLPGQLGFPSLLTAKVLTKREICFQERRAGYSLVLQPNRNYMAYSAVETSMWHNDIASLD